MTASAVTAVPALWIFLSAASRIGLTASNLARYNGPVSITQCDAAAHRSFESAGDAPSAGRLEKPWYGRCTSRF